MWSCFYVYCLDCYTQQVALKFFQYRSDFSTVISFQYSSSINNANQDWSCASFMILLEGVLYIYWNAHNSFCKSVWNILNWNIVLSLIFYILDRFYIGGTRWSSSLSLCVTSWKVAVSIPDSVFGIFYWHNPSGPTITLVSAQPLNEMSTRNISCKGWQPYHLYVVIVLKFGNLKFLEPSGSVLRLLYFIFTGFISKVIKYS